MRSGPWSSSGRCLVACDILVWGMMYWKKLLGHALSDSKCYVASWRILLMSVRSHTSEVWTPVIVKLVLGGTRHSCLGHDNLDGARGLSQRVRARLSMTASTLQLLCRFLARGMDEHSLRCFCRLSFTAIKCCYFSCALHERRRLVLPIVEGVGRDTLRTGPWSSSGWRLVVRGTLKMTIM